MKRILDNKKKDKYGNTELKYAVADYAYEGKPMPKQSEVDFEITPEFVKMYDKMHAFYEECKERNGGKKPTIVMFYND